MSSATFDPNNIRVEDLFRAKEERRQRLAKLPFEEKIKIVKRLQTVPAKMAENEKLIFDSFLRVCPDFAGEPIKEWDVVDEWYAKRALAPPAQPFDKRPDVIALTASGKRIGVDLKSWVNREQITEARREERIRENILNAIGKPQPPNETKHIGYVWPYAKRARFDKNDATEFRDQLFRLISQVDTAWSRKPPWKQMSSDDVDRFDQFPLLEKYLHRIRFRPAARSRGTVRWIRFPDAGRHYSPNQMLETLSSSLAAHKGGERYKYLAKHLGLDEVDLLVHYDFKAFAYNTPFDAPGFGFKEAANFARESLNSDGGYFDRIFLFHFLSGQEKAERIF